MPMTDWTILRRSLRSRMVSTVVTILTVGVAVALMLVLLTVRGAGRAAFDRGTGDMHLIVSADSSPLVSVLNGVFYANPPQRALTWEQYQRIARSAPFAYAIPTQQGDSFRGFPVLATTRDFFDKYQPNVGEPWKLAAGEFLDAPFEVVVGSTAARRANIRVGDTLYVSHTKPGEKDDAEGSHDDHAHDEHAHDEHDHEHGHDHEHAHREFPFKVVGILTPTGGAHDRAIFIDLTSTWVMHAHDRRLAADPGASLTTEADLTDTDRKITGIYLKLVTRDGSAAPANLPQVFAQLRAAPSITVANPKTEVDNLFRIVNNLDALFLALAGAILLSSGIAIMLALYNSMELRRRQVAILRVLGATRGRVFSLVLTESAVLGLLGAAAGIVLALGGSVAAAAVLRERTGVVINPVVDLEPVILVSAAAVLLACLAGLVPAVMAYRTPVANNLRPIG